MSFNLFHIVAFSNIPADQQTNNAFYNAIDSAPDNP